MKIILDNIIFSLQHSGGISVVWKELITRMLCDNDFQVQFVEYKNDNLFRKDLNIPKNQILSNVSPSAPISILRFLDPNLNGKFLFHSSYYRIINKPGIRNVTTIHDFTYTFYRRGLPRYVHNIQKERAIKNSEKIICISESTKNDLLHLYPNINETKLTVIYNGVSNEYRKLDIFKTDLNSLIPYNPYDFVIYVGDRQSAYKNFKLAALAAKSARIPLVIVGGRIPSKSEIDFLNKSLGQNRYFFFRNASNEILNIIYNNALCLLYPSLYEGFGIPIIEAQKAGCPVICSDKSSIPEIAGDGAVILKKIDADEICDAIRILKVDNSFRNSIIIKGEQNSNRFSWDNCYHQTKEVYKEIYS